MKFSPDTWNKKRFIFLKEYFKKDIFRKKSSIKPLLKLTQVKIALMKEKKKRLFKWEEFILDDVNPTNYHKSSNNNKRSSTEKLKM